MKKHKNLYSTIDNGICRGEKNKDENKFNKSDLSDKGNKKLKTWQKVLLSVLGAIVGVVLVCVIVILIGNNSAMKDTDSPEEYTTSIYENIIGWEAGEDDYANADLSPVKIVLSDKKLSEFEEYIATKGNYKYGDAYQIDKAIDYMNNHHISSTKHKHDIRVNGELDANALYKLVKSNNKKFFDDKDNFSAYWYEEYSNNKLKGYCNQIVEMLNGIHNKYPQTDMDEVCCYLYDLKILNKKAAIDFAAVEIEKKILHINEDMLESWSDLKDNERMPEEILHHEMMHLFQVSCDCNCAEGDVTVGIAHDYDALDINSLRWYWLVESSAEMNACEYLGMDYITYQAKIGYANTLNFLLNLSESDKEARIQDLCFDRNADIYQLFDMNTDEEKEEFAKMMYSIEILQQDPDDFTDWYSKEHNVDLISDSQAETKMHLNVKEDALITLTKLFYRNLARMINTGKATLQDAYYLMRIYECDLQNHMSNNEVSYMIYFKDLYPVYLEIREEFFKAISSENGMSIDELNKGFSEYSINVTDGKSKQSPNCTLAFLSDEQKKGIYDYQKVIYRKGYPNMTEAYELCKEWLEKAPYDDIIFDD